MNPTIHVSYKDLSTAELVQKKRAIYKTLNNPKPGEDYENDSLLAKIELQVINKIIEKRYNTG